jgi:hypothetical protein
LDGGGHVLELGVGVGFGDAAGVVAEADGVAARADDAILRVAGELPEPHADASSAATAISRNQPKVFVVTQR